MIGNLFKGGPASGLKFITKSIGLGNVFGFLDSTPLGSVFDFFTSITEGPSTQGGLETEFPTSGEAVPQKFIMGRYATAGHYVAPPNSHGAGNRYLTYVIEVSSVKGVSLRRVFIDETLGTLDTGSTDPDYGDPVVEFSRTQTIRTLNNAGTESAYFSESTTLDPYAWVKFYDGSQTTADAMLLAEYGSDPDRPWTAAMVGEGIAYAICTFRLSEKFYDALPKVLFELDGIPLYDPRLDTTAGGSGSHRWADTTTWETSANAALMIYNLYRGIPMEDGSIYGGSVPADDLPFDNWTAAMDACDVDVDGRPQFEAGLEIDVSQEPAKYIEALLPACLGRVSEYGGKFRIQVGSPASPVYSITDDDIVISDSSELQPFPGAESTYNTMTGTFLAPDDMWEQRELTPVTDASAETADGKKLEGQLNLGAVFSQNQGQHILEASLADGRRFLTHVLALPPEASALEPLDTISWTSTENGYTAKVFEIIDVVDDPGTLVPRMVVRERESGDFTRDPGDELPEPAGVIGVTEPSAISVSGWAVQSLSVRDDGSDLRRVGLLLSWTASLLTDISLLEYQVRVAATGEVVATGMAAADAWSVRVTTGLLPATQYEARGRYVSDTASDWTSWASATTASLYLLEEDLDPTVTIQLSTAAERTAEASSRHAATIASAQALIDSLESDVIQSLGPLGQPTSLKADIIDAFGPIDGVEVPLVERVTVIEPAQRSVEDRLENIAEQVGWAISNIGRTDARLAEAGIYLDPDSGRVTIQGVESLQNQVSDVRIDINAVEATLSLKATVAYVNQAISNAVLDPSQIPVVDDLQVRITAVEILADANAASLSLKASTTTVSGIDTRLTTAEADIDSLEGSIVLKAEQTDLDAVDARLTTAETELSVLDGAAIRQTVIDTQQQFDLIDTNAMTSLAALWDAFEDREAIRTGIAFAQSEILAVVNDNEAASATARTTLGARIDDADAAIVAEAAARADADSAIASDVTTLQADLTATDANVAANAAATTALDARVTSAEGTITSQGSAITALEAGLTTAEDEIDANAAAASALDVRVTANEGEITLNADATNTLALSSGDRLDELAATNVEGIWAAFQERDQLRDGMVFAQSQIMAVLNDGLDAEATARLILAARMDDAEAAIVTEQTARADADSALASDISILQAGLTSAEGDIDAQASAATALEARVTANEGDIASSASDITNLQSTLATAQGDIAGNADAISQLTTDISTAEGNIEASATQIASLTVSAGDEIDTLAENSLIAAWSAFEERDAMRSTTAAAQSELLVVINEGVDAEATARLTLAGRVDDAEAAILSEQTARADADSAIASDVTVLQAGLSAAQDDIATNASAVSVNASGIAGLDVRVTAAEGSITSQASQITTLQTDLSAAEDDILTNAAAASANSSAISALDSRVTTAEGSIASQASSITSLQTDVSGAQTDIATNASAISGNSSAIGALDSRVTTAEGNITAQASDISDLQTGLATTDGNVTANASAISALDTRVTTAEGTITSQSASITALQSDLSAAEVDIATNAGAAAANASAISGLDTRVTAAEGSIVSQASSLTELTARVSETSNLIPNGEIADGTFWTPGAQWSVVSPATSYLNRRSRGAFVYTYVAGTGYSASTNSYLFECIPGAAYLFSAQIQRTGGSGQASVRMRVQWCDASGGTISHVDVFEETTNSDTLERYSNQLTAPALAFQARVKFDVDRAASSTGAVVAGPEMQRVGDAGLDAQASITSLESVKVDAAGAVAAIDTEISAQFGSIYSMAVASAYAEATADTVQSGFIFRAGTGGASGTLEIVGGDDINGVPSSVKIAADNVYISGSTQIADAVITNAKIGDAEVDTLKIAGNAVTVPISDGGTTWTTSSEILPAFTNAEAGALVVILSMDIDAPSGADAVFVLEYRVDGVTVDTMRVVVLDDKDHYTTAMFRVPSLSAGAHTHSLHKTGAALTVNSWSMFGIVTMR